MDAPANHTDEGHVKGSTLGRLTAPFTFLALAAVPLSATAHGGGIAAGEFDELILAIREGATYVNVHTTGRPGGEVRGQIR